MIDFAHKEIERLKL